MIRGRWVAGVGIIAGAVLGGRLGVVATAAELLIVGVAVLIYNALLTFTVHRFKVRGYAPGRPFWIASGVADVVALMTVVYFSGGVENPIGYLCIFYIGCIGILLSAREGYLIATLAVSLHGLIGVLQATFPSLYHAMGLGFGGRCFDNWPFVGLTIFIFSVAMYASVWLTTTITRRLLYREEEVVRQRDVLDSIISSMSDALVFLAPDGTPQLWNSAGAQWLLRSNSTQHPAAFGDSAIPGGLRTYIERIKNASAPLPSETFWVPVRAKPGEPARHFRATASSVLDDRSEHVGYVIVAEDLTEHLSLEHKLRERNRELYTISEALGKNQKKLAEREKMFVLGTMAAGVAHEIGNPLACLSAISQLLKRRSPSSEDRNHLDTLEQQVQRIAKIVRELLEFARPQTGQWAWTDLGKLIEQTIKMLRYSHRSRHAEIVCVENTTLPKVRVMPHQFQQVLINLLLNALDAVKGLEGTPIVTVESSVENNWVSVRVSDQGAGMTEEQVNQAFEPFYTTKAPGEGSGLGLAVSYRLIEQHGGRIEIESSPGEGTVVTVLFPVDPTVRDEIAAEGGQDALAHT